MKLNVPVTATNIAEWVRRAAAAINALLSDVERLKAPPPLTSIVFVPSPLPLDPAKGMTVYDQADDKLKVWTGASWQPLF